MIAVYYPLFTSCSDPATPTAGKESVQVEVDWSGYGKSTPSGMTILFHHQETGEKTQVIDNNVTRLTTRLSPGRHWATAFNLTENEFDNIRFSGLDSAETARAYAAEHPGSKWYDTPAGTDGYVASQPEWLAVDTILTNPVEPHSTTLSPEMTVAGTLHPRNIIHTLHLTIRIGNIGNLRAARGAISGLAAGRRLSADRPDDNTVTVTHLIEPDNWTERIASSPSDTTGFIRTEIRCFGLPSNHSGTPGENRLELQTLLADGKTVKIYDIPVGHLINRPDTPPGCRGDDLDLFLEVSLQPALPPVSGSGDKGGIDVWFDDWDDHIDFNMPI